MKPCHLEVPLNEHPPAVLHVPAPLSRELLDELDRSLHATLAGLRRRFDTVAEDAGLIEYASWLPQRRQ